MRHVSDAPNSTWSDVFIESTFMRYGHITLNDNAMKRWALSPHSCSKLILDLTLMRDVLPDNPTHNKEKAKARMLSDSSDRQKLQAKLSQCIDPLNPVGHSTTLFDIVSGKIDDSSVNVQNFLQLGKKCMQC